MIRKKVLTEEELKQRMSLLRLEIQRLLGDRDAGSWKRRLSNSRKIKVLSTQFDLLTNPINYYNFSFFRFL